MDGHIYFFWRQFLTALYTVLSWHWDHLVLILGGAICPFSKMFKKFETTDQPGFQTLSSMKVLLTLVMYEALNR